MNLHENDKKEKQVQRQVQQISDKFQVEDVDSFVVPLPLHHHVANIEDILQECRNGRCCQDYIPAEKRTR